MSLFRRKKKDPDGYCDRCPPWQGYVTCPGHDEPTVTVVAQDPPGPLVYCKHTGAGVNYPCDEKCDSQCALETKPEFYYLYIGDLGFNVSLGDRLVIPDDTFGSIGSIAMPHGEYEVIDLLNHNGATPQVACTAKLKPVEPLTDEEMLEALQGIVRIAQDG